MRFTGSNSRRRSGQGRDSNNSESYMLDPLLIPRLKHFSYNNDINDVDGCVEYLRSCYKEYSRKQEGPFRRSVMKAIYIIKQKQESSPSRRQAKLQDQEDIHARRVRSQFLSEGSSDSSGSEKEEEESSLSRVRDPQASCDDGESRGETSVRKKKKRKRQRNNTGEDEVLSFNPSFNLLNVSLRSAYHGGCANEKVDMNGSCEAASGKETEISKQTAETGEPITVRAFAPPDVIAAAARAVNTKISKRHAKESERSINSTDLAPKVAEVVQKDPSDKPGCSSGNVNALENHTLSKMIQKGNIKGSEKTSIRNAKPEKQKSKPESVMTGTRERENVLSTTPEAICFSDLGGIDNALESIKEVMFSLYNPGVYSWLGLQPTRGILLHGPPGCGKTKLANAIAHEAGLPFLKISGPEIVSGMSGESEAKVRSVFAEASRLAPCIIFIDEIDSIASKRESAQREMEKRIVTQLMTCMDELSDNSVSAMDDFSTADCKRHILVIGATNRPEGLDPALRRPGRFDHEILLGVPDENGRAQILSALAKKLRLEGSFDFNHIARCTPGFVGADLAALTRAAGRIAIKRIMTYKTSQWTHDVPLKDKCEDQSCNTLQSISFQEPVELTTSQSDNYWWKQQWPQESLNALSITMQDFKDAVPLVQPSTKREGFSAIPNVKWDDVGALDSVRNSMEFFISRRIKHPQEYEQLGMDTDRGFLLYGPPGCGKTLVAKAIANDAQANFIYIKGPELLNKYVGESEHAVRSLFARARSCAPCIIFFDEMDALAPRRGTDGNAVAERVLNQLLSEMDGADKQKGVFLIGATNRPDTVDPAVLRPGRLGKLLYISLPDSEGRHSILKALTKRKPISTDVDLASIAANKLCEGFSGADLAALVTEASMAALQENCAASASEAEPEKSGPLLIHNRHFHFALHQVSPSVSRHDMLYYDGLPKKFNRSTRMQGIASEAFT